MSNQLKIPASHDNSLKICYFGTYRSNYSRNQMMIAGLKLNDVDVVECHQTLWHGIEDRVRVVSGEWLNPTFWWRVIKSYWNLLKKYHHIGHYDMLVLGYPGQFDVFIARLLTWLRHKPLVWDVFMSLYLISLERGLDKKSHISTSMVKLIESMALKVPDMLILDTKEYVEWFSKNYGINPTRFRLVPTGADDRIFFPVPNNDEKKEEFYVLYSGTFIPNHGVMYIVDSAKHLQNETEIHFELVGSGPELEKAREFVINNQLKNVEFFNWMEKDQLKQKMSQADICLGAFGTTPQSLMTVQNKIYETLAMKRPLISGDSAAIRGSFVHGEHIFLCNRADGKSLAEAIITLWKDPKLRSYIAENGYKLYTEQFDLHHNGQRFATYLAELIK
jgi:glycosyltransferase involved in cell wall biosynthesis